MSQPLPYILDVVTPPTGFVVSVGEMEDHLRWEDASEASVILGLIKAATSYVQDISGKQLLTATYDVQWARFPGCNGALVLPRVPVSSVTSVKYYDTTGTQQTMSSALYTVQDGSEHFSGYVIPAFNGQWPSTYGHDQDVTVRFVCGFGTPSDVPETFKLQIKLLVAHWFEHREAIACGDMSPTPLAFAALEEFNRHQEFV